MKGYNVMIDGKNFFDHPIKNKMKTYDDIRKIATGQGDDYTTGCLPEYNYFNKHYTMMAIDLNKQQAIDADPKEIQKIDFTGNLNRPESATMFFIIEVTKETILDFPQGNMRVLGKYSTILFCFNIMSI